MTKSTITRERAQQIFLGNGPEPSTSEERELARMALAAMDSESHTDDELSNLLWYSQEATCHSDPNYYCEFQRLATPGLIAGIIRELQERRKADSEPVAWLLSGGGAKNVVCFDSGNAYADPLREVAPLYRHAQPAPVVPDAYVRDEHGRMMLNGVCEPKIGFGTGWNACRAAMLAAAPHDTPALNSVQSVVTVQGKWIPVSERMPEDRTQAILWDAEIGEVTSGHYSHKTQTFYHCGDAIQNEITHWMPMPAAPREVK